MIRLSFVSARKPPITSNYLCQSTNQLSTINTNAPSDKSNVTPIYSSLQQQQQQQPQQQQQQQHPQFQLLQQQHSQQPQFPECEHQQSQYQQQALIQQPLRQHSLNQQQPIDQEAQLQQQPYFQQQQQELTKKCSKSYNIDYIVNSHKKLDMGLVANGSVIKTTTTTTNGATKRDKENIVTSYVSDYRDFCSEVKHARTPINNVPPTHSPQLPIPSPNYPVQTQLTIDTVSSVSTTTTITTTTTTTTTSTIMPTFTTTITTMTTTTITTNTTTTSTDINFFDKKKYIPNTHVPTLNNNYISAAPHHTSQKDTTNTVNTTTTIMKTISELNEASNTNLYNQKNNYINHSLNNINNTSTTTTTNTLFTVLNVPNLINFQIPPTKKPKLSKIDLGIIKRRKRRKLKNTIKINNDNNKLTIDNNNKLNVTQKYCYDFGVKVYGYTDSSSSNSSYTSSSECDSDSEIDLWIKTGPPCKLDVKPEKLNFLNCFELTTHDKRNCKFEFHVVTILFY